MDPSETTIASDGGPSTGEAPDLVRVVEALLFSSEEPVSLERLTTVLEAEERARVLEAVQALVEECRLPGRSWFVEEVAGGWRLTTKPEFAPWVRKLLRVRREERLSAAALEILAVVAYRQPIIKAEIDALRGVQSDGALRGLLERKLLKVVGRAEVLGRPLLYGTTREFLEKFGLATLKDLPRPEEFCAKVTGGAAPPPADIAAAAPPIEGLSALPIEETAAPPIEESAAPPAADFAEPDPGPGPGAP
jgi:segregation and condensation protein B